MDDLFAKLAEVEGFDEFGIVHGSKYKEYIELRVWIYEWARRYTFRRYALRQRKWRK